MKFASLDDGGHVQRVYDDAVNTSIPNVAVPLEGLSDLELANWQRLRYARGGWQYYGPDTLEGRP